MTTERVGIPSETTDFSVRASVGQACTQAPHETHSERQEVGAAGGDPRVEAAPLDGQREGALGLRAGPHAARADDARGRVVGEVGVRRVGLLGQVRRAAQPVAHLGHADVVRQRLHLAAARARTRRSRWGGRTGRAPSPRGAAAAPARCGSTRPCRRCTASCTRPACPCTPSTSTRQSRHDPNALSESVAHSLGTSTPASPAARITDVPAGTSTSTPSMVTCAVASPATGGVPRSGVSRAGRR